jgi:hypothetical protein
MFFLGALILVLAWSIALITNAINAAISKEYFSIVMGGRWRTVGIIFQGLDESSYVAAIYYAIFLSLYCGMTHCRLPLRNLLPSFAITFAGCLFLHLCGGIAGWLFATTQPTLFSKLVPFSTQAADPRSFAYVGGSIWGVYLGAVVAIPFLITRLISAWRRHRSGISN